MIIMDFISDENKMITSDNKYFQKITKLTLSKFSNINPQNMHVDGF